MEDLCPENIQTMEISLADKIIGLQKGQNLP